MSSYQNLEALGSVVRRN